MIITSSRNRRPTAIILALRPSSEPARACHTTAGTVRQRAWFREIYGLGCESFGHEAASFRCHEKKNLVQWPADRANQQGIGHHSAGAPRCVLDNRFPCEERQADHERHAAKMRCDPNNTNVLERAAACYEVLECNAAGGTRKLYLLAATW